MIGCDNSITGDTSPQSIVYYEVSATDECCVPKEDDFVLEPEDNPLNNINLGRLTMPKQVHSLKPEIRCRRYDFNRGRHWNRKRK